jgi:hypothetical protein
MTSRSFAAGFALLTLSTVWLAAFACSSDKVGFIEDSGQKVNYNPPGTNTIAPIGTTVPDAAADAPFAVCKAVKQDAKVRAAHVVFSLDVSSSMCEPNPVSGCGDSFTKLSQAFRALDRFFRSTSGVTTSFISWCGALDAAACASSFDKSLLKPEVVPLPSSSLIDQVKANSRVCDDTPTSAAIRGALRHTNALKASMKDTRMMTILITDGLPRGCGDLDEAKVAARESKDAGVPLHVLGVGSKLDNLNQIAAEGGTQRAYVIDTRDPNKVGDDLSVQLAQIRSKGIGCEMDVPVSTDAKPLNFNQVNVTLTLDGVAKRLGYSPDCQAPNGWRYDVKPEAGTPTKVLLCEQACASAGNNATAKLAYEVGCATVGPN